MCMMIDTVISCFFRFLYLFLSFNLFTKCRPTTAFEFCEYFVVVDDKTHCDPISKFKSKKVSEICRLEIKTAYKNIKEIYRNPKEKPN